LTSTIDPVAPYLEARAALRLDRVTIAIPDPIRLDARESLLSDERVVSLILADGQAGRHDRVGHFAPGRAGWALPAAIASTILVLGDRRVLTFRMGASALRQGVLQVAYRTAFGWKRRTVSGLLVQRLVRRLAIIAIERSRRLQLPDALRPRNAIQRVLNRLTGRGRGVTMRVVANVTARTVERGLVASISAALATDNRLLPRYAFVPRRIVTVNSALAWGGAERQLSNTLLGLASRGFDDLTLLCESLGVVPDSDFFRWRLADRSIEVSALRRTAGSFVGQLRQDDVAGLSRRLSRLPGWLAEAAAPYALEFLARRPEVVHAWQDQTNLLAGMAAVITGVPRIILAGRNLAPFRFAYFQPHMRSGYRALLECPGVTLLNNSQAGVEDYAAWLMIPPERIALLRNGLDFSACAAPTAAEHEAYRCRLGIDAGALVVGSIFRFYEEKDPLLWIEAAARVARVRPELMLLLIGTGPMQSQIQARAAELGIADRLRMPGTEKLPGLPLSIMDAFLLTSHAEGLPNVVIEAQSLGVPVVATAAGGTREAVLEERTGWIVETRNPDQLGDRLLDILSDDRLRQRVRTLAPQFVAERFGLDRMIDETVELYGIRS